MSECHQAHSQMGGTLLDVISGKLEAMNQCIGERHEYWECSVRFSKVETILTAK
jgi:hypothetical protein